MLDKLASIVPEVKFIVGDNFAWSPEDKTITYPKTATDNDNFSALLHEAGHAILGHEAYRTDYQLLRMEVDAWEKAKEIATQLNFIISDDHIQDCLDSYRDWLYKRCICPSCGTKTIQNDLSNSYSCFNCHTCWGVTPSRFCRVYRTTKQNELVII